MADDSRSREASHAGGAGSPGSYILGTLDDGDIDWLVDHGRRRTVAAGERILDEGRPISALVLVLEGELEARNEGVVEQTPTRLGPGSLVGGIGLLGGETAPTSVVAVARSILLELPYSELSSKLDFDVGFAARFYRAIAAIVIERTLDVLGHTTLPSGAPDFGGRSVAPAHGVNTFLAGDRMRRLLRRADPGDTVVVTGGDLTIEDVVRVARRFAPVVLSDGARHTLEEARAVVEELASRGDPVYGLTTNLGELKDSRLDDAQQPLFQRHVLLSHATGVGPEFAQDAVRAIMLARLNGMARGGAGVQPVVFEAMMAMLNARVHPVVPMRGSIGMSDLAPLAHLALPLVGEGEVELDGQRMPASEALAAAAVEVPELGPKDALSLVSANSASIGHGALVIYDARALLGIADIAAALSLEALGGHTTMLDQQVDTARRFSGQLTSAQHTRALLEGSYLWTTKPTLDVQDPISFRSAIQVHGAMLDVLALTRSTLETELNSTGDNPMVIIDRREMVGTGNFHPAGVSIAFDTLAVALAQVTSMAANRVVRLMDPAFTHLPPYLSVEPGVNVGLGVVQKTATALNAEVRLGANPASLDYLPVAGSIEDHATMAVEGVAKAARSIEAATGLFAIEMLVASQAIDLRSKPKLGTGTRAAYETIRSRVPMMAEDRLVARDIDAVHELLTGGELIHAVSQATGMRMLGTFGYEADGAPAAVAGR